MDWAYKEQLRNTEVDKYNGKSMMFNHENSRRTSNNQVVDLFYSSKVTKLESELIEQKSSFANELFTKPYSELVLNSAWLFEQVPELLETHQVKTTHMYNKSNMKKEKIYWLDPVGDLEEYVDKSYIKNIAREEKIKNVFTFLTGKYTYGQVYKLADSGKLTPLFPDTIPMPELGTSIVQMASRATMQRGMRSYSCNLTHDSASYTFNYTRNQYKFKSDGEICDYVYKHNSEPKYINSNNLIASKAPAITIKFSQIAKPVITHIGLIGSAPCVLSVKKNTNNERIHFFDYANTDPAFITKFELSYKSLKTKKWVWLKNYSLSSNWFDAITKEQVIDLTEFSNGHSDGIETNELRIVPTEYYGDPYMRIAVYGINKTGSGKTKSESDDLVGYELSTINKSNKMLKRGHGWSEGRLWYSHRFDNKMKKEAKRNLDGLRKKLSRGNSTSDSESDSLSDCDN